ncbi:hypothetical protein PLICRDRAFT_161541 [Plicaturopsis crispa FD-325 SS-3]|nr:hypothetical protein PLICRDRAFT_161541 [Plicaturopsis crispa FD-325 SS-3]
MAFESTDSSKGKEPGYDTDRETTDVAVERSDDFNDAVSDIVPGRREIGLLSATFLIFNRIIGTGVFATPATILGQAGSVGLALFLWVIGAIVAVAGMMVYAEYGIAIPRNGAEKNYLEYVYRRPKYFITSVYAADGVLLAWAASNSIVFGEYILNAANVEVGRWNQRGVALACLTFAWLLHGTSRRAGLWLQNVLGVFKLGVLIFVVITGWVALSGRTKIPKTWNNFDNAFEGTTTSATSVVNGLYNVIWSYIGYSNLNYALAETKNPRRTVLIAGPTAIAIVTVLYVLANIAYFAGAPKEDILASKNLVAALLFKNVYGATGEKAISVIVAISALGNVLSVIFSQGRGNQELAREGILPFSKFFGSNRPFNAPFVGLGLHWFVGLITIIALPPGDAYSFVINVISYPLAIVNSLIAAGLVYLYWRPYPDWNNKSFKASWPVALFFFAFNVFLWVVPLVKPPAGSEPYVSLPYWSHAVGGWAVLGIGALYWVIWAQILPRLFGYKLERREEVGKDGLLRNVFHAVKNE